MRIKKSDKVIVIAGKDKGKQGIVREILKEQNKAIVEGINIVTYHRKPTQVNPEGGIIKQEGPIDISNLMIIEGKGKSAIASRVGYKFVKNKKTGKLEKVRYIKKTNQEL